LIGDRLVSRYFVQYAITRDSNNTITYSHKNLYFDLAADLIQRSGHFKEICNFNQTEKFKYYLMKTKLLFKCPHEPSYFLAQERILLLINVIMIKIYRYCSCFIRNRINCLGYMCVCIYIYMSLASCLIKHTDKFTFSTSFVVLIVIYYFRRFCAK
jgi:hypothetical protein